MRPVSFGLTDVGRRRSLNEDSLYRNDEMQFYVVADGVGGHSRGEVASRETVEQLEMWVHKFRAQIDELSERWERGDDDARWEIRRLLENGVKHACYMVFGMAELDPDKRGMSTTCSAMLLCGSSAFAVHVGDSRVYRMRDGEVLQLTEDHTLVNYKLKQGLMTPAQARNARGKNVITRAVGHKDYVQVDTVDVDIRVGDRFLLCTDGLHNYLRNHDEIRELIADDSIDACAHAAISLANQRGGKDNITTIVVEVIGR